MFGHRAVHTTICASCRLRSSIAAKQFARTRRVFPKPTARWLNTTQTLRQEDKSKVDHTSTTASEITPVSNITTPEDAALRARKIYGDVLPENALNEDEYRVYKRLCGVPERYEERTEIVQEGLEDGGEEVGGTGVLREVEGGALVEVGFEGEGEEEVEETDEDDGGVQVRDGDGFGNSVDARLARDIEASLSSAQLSPYNPDESHEEEDEPPYARAHPLTVANRFTTSPSTLALPNSTSITPIESQLSGISNTHLSQAAHRVFGGIGLPYSTSTPALAKTMQAKPIPLTAEQGHMSEIEGDLFLATLFPGVYATVMSSLMETRKRLGSVWAEELVRKAEKGDLRVLDAGGAGAGVLAVREMLRAEWERLHEDSTEMGSSMALAEADGRVGGVGMAPPLGHATVLTGSDVLRKRASRLLESTTFIPRLPDYVHTENARKKGKFDIVIAPHTLWPLKEDYLRKTHVLNLWSLLSQDGGILVLLEKGVPRGFELIAAARNMLLNSHISSAQQDEEHSALDQQKETGMIIAPCTNHSSCPMYKPEGMVKGRRDICHFSQRYVRPPVLQKILGARDKNFEDVKFSYFSVMRGRDLRQAHQGEEAVKQNDEVTDRAFTGYGSVELSLAQQQHLSLSLPRTVLPPLKRRGHVILDLCTPSGTLERWTVPKSFSRQAFRDARKSSWGDLWALGAKTRVPRVPRVPKIKTRASKADMDAKLVKQKLERDAEMVVDYDEEGKVVVRERGNGGDGGKGGGSGVGKGRGKKEKKRKPRAWKKAVVT